VSNSFPISLDRKASDIKPASHDAPLKPASDLLRQGNKFASQEQFSEADKVFRTAASLPDGKAIWNFKSLGFCPSVFPDVSSIDAFWQQLDQGTLLYVHDCTFPRLGVKSLEFSLWCNAGTTLAFRNGLKR